MGFLEAEKWFFCVLGKTMTMFLMGISYHSNENVNKRNVIIYILLFLVVCLFVCVTSIEPSSVFLILSLKLISKIQTGSFLNVSFPHDDYANK